MSQNINIYQNGFSGGGGDSPTHFFIRQKEEEFDVNLLDEHDSFYHTTKSLLVLFQIMGVMPIMRSPPGKGRWSKTLNFQLNYNQFE